MPKRRPAPQPEPQDPHNGSPHKTTFELADRLRASPRTVKRKYKDWGLKPARIGGKLLFHIADIEAFEQRLRETGARA